MSNDSEVSDKHAANRLKIVVARYNESVAWTRSFPNVVVYNKGEPLPVEDHYTEIRLDNVGREGHTYYQHIYDNYDNLDDYTAFLQGNPFDHIDNFTHVLWSCVRSVERGDWTHDFKYFSDERVRYHLLYGCSFHPGLPLVDVYKQLFLSPELAASVQPRRPFSRHHLPEHVCNFDKIFSFGPGAQFVVSKARILSRPRSFYRKIVDMLGKSVRPEEGYVIERFHPLILGDSQLP